MRRAQVAAVTPVGALAAAGGRELIGANEQEPADEVGEPEEGNAEALRSVTRADDAIVRKHRRDPREHGERPEDDPPEAVLCEMAAVVLHGAEYALSSSRSDWEARILLISVLAVD